MKNSVLFEFLLVLLVFVLFGCATSDNATNAKNITSRFDFVAFYGRYDSQKPLEEQSFLINLTPKSGGGEGFTIKTVDDGEVQIYMNSWGLGTNQLTIVQPGMRTIGWDYAQTSASYGSSNLTISTSFSENNKMNFEFEPGQYYYFMGERNGRTVTAHIYNINNADHLSIQSNRDNLKSANMVSIAPEELKNEINAAIARGMKIISKSEKQPVYKVFDEKTPENLRAVLVVPGKFLTVNEFSGTKVKWSGKGMYTSSYVSIPSGSHTLKFKGSLVDNKSLTADFQPGQMYLLRQKTIGNEDGLVIANLAQIIHVGTGKVVAEIR